MCASKNQMKTEMISMKGLIPQAVLATILLLLRLTRSSIKSPTTSAFSTFPQPLAIRKDPLLSSTVTTILSSVAPKNDKLSNGITITEENLLLPSNISMQVICGISSTFIAKCSDNNNTITQYPPVLLFLHGSFHGAWCYQEHYIPYFVEKGYIAIAPSWRGTGGTPVVQINEKNVKIQDHVNDLYHLLKSISSILLSICKKRSGNNMPIIIQSDIKPSIYMISHSFGGIVVMNFFEKYYRTNVEMNKGLAYTIQGLIVMCSVPPSGNGPMTIRFLKRSLMQSYRITVGFAMKKCCTNTQLCRQLFFDSNDDSDSISDLEVQRYQSYFTRDSKVTIDLIDLAKRLPSKQTHRENGTATYIDKDFPKSLIIGAVHDYIVDQEALYETARYFNCYDENLHPKATIIDSSHDVMLGTKWSNGANTILQWIQAQQDQTNLKPD